MTMREMAKALHEEIFNGVVRLTTEEQLACMEHALQAERATVWEEAAQLYQEYILAPVSDDTFEQWCRQQAAKET